MSVRRMKAWMMTAACAGVLVASAGNAQAFCFGLFKKKDAAPTYTTQKVKVTEYVPTYVDEVVSVMRPTMKTETYTAHRYECVPETVTKQVTVNKMVTETVMENKCITERVPVQKTVTVMERVPVTKQVTVNETRWNTVQVTEMRSRVVTSTVQVPVCVDDHAAGYGAGDAAGASGGRKGLFARLKAHCCGTGEKPAAALYDPCNPCPDPCAPVACPPAPKIVYKTQTCSHTVCEPVTVCKRVAECVPVCKTVCTYECVPVQKQCTVYECVTKTIQVPCTRTRCVPTCETVTCTVNTMKCVPYTCTRQVCVNECVQETRKVCKMVPTVVEKDVQVCVPACPPACAPACPPACAAAPCDPCAMATGTLCNDPCAEAAEEKKGCCWRIKKLLGIGR
jgi:hypothetical protein